MGTLVKQTLQIPPFYFEFLNRDLSTEFLQQSISLGLLNKITWNFEGRLKLVTLSTWKVVLHIAPPPPPSQPGLKGMFHHFRKLSTLIFYILRLHPPRNSANFQGILELEQRCVLLFLVVLSLGGNRVRSFCMLYLQNAKMKFPHTFRVRWRSVKDSIYCFCSCV